MTTQFTALYVQRAINESDINGVGRWRPVTADFVDHVEDTFSVYEVTSYKAYDVPKRQFNDVAMYRAINATTCEVETFRFDEWEAQLADGWTRIKKQTVMEHSKLLPFITIKT